MSVSMSGNLPAGDGNGLQAIVPELIRNPKKIHVAIVMIDTRKVTTDADSGDVRPTVRVRRIEVIDNLEDLRVAERLLRRALDKRTGHEALPYDLEEELSEVFDNFTADEPEPAPRQPEASTPEPDPDKPVDGPPTPLDDEINGILMDGDRKTDPPPGDETSGPGDEKPEE